MSMVSHLHQLFNPETCQSYIHNVALERSAPQCPRCQSHNVGPWDFLPFVNPSLSNFYPSCTTGSR